MKVISSSCKVGVLSVLILLLVSAAHAVPRTINYQGVLTQPNGTVINGQVSLQLSLYTAASGGTPLWQETQTVDVSQGLFDVQLGAVTPLTLPFDAPYFLGVKAGSDQEMQPRQPLTSVPYALRASVADTVPDQAVTAAKLGETCVDGEILRFNAHENVWQCSASDASDSFFTTHGVVGVLTIDGVTGAGPVVPHDGSELLPYENIIVHDFHVDIVAVDGSHPVIYPITFLCDPTIKAPTIFSKLLQGSVIPRITLWLPDNTGAFVEFIEIQGAVIISQTPIAPTRLGDENLIQYSIVGSRYQFSGDYFNSGDSILVNVEEQTNEGGCAFEHDFVLERGLSSPIPGDPIDSFTAGVSIPTPDPNSGGPTGRPTFNTINITSTANEHSICLVGDAVKYQHILELTLSTPSPIDPTQVESEIALNDAMIESYSLSLDSQGVLKQQFSVNFSAITTSSTIYDPDTGEALGTSEYGWDLDTNAPL